MARRTPTAQQGDHHQLFRRVAWKRFEEAELLMKGDGKTRFTTGAVYLAGHAVECILKAVLLHVTPATARDQVFRECKDVIGHNLNTVIERLALRGVRIPRSLARHRATIETWDNESRYDPRTVKLETAESFMSAAKEIMRWGEGQLT